MAYTILNSDGTTLLLLTDSTVDQSTTSLSLVGKNVANYGQYLNNNFVGLLQNFANTSNNPPRSPTTGQLWYDTTTGKLNVYDGNFKSVSGAIVSSVQPNLLSSGDLWWDTANNQLKVFNLTQTYIIGPAFPKEIGSTGLTMPEQSIVSTTSSLAQDVIFLENYGQTVAAISNQTFDMTLADSQTYTGSNSTATLVQGLNVFGNIRATGQITNNYLSMSVDITKLESIGAPNWDVSTLAGYNAQNTAIAKLLASVYPVAANTSTNDVGVPLGSRARVLCSFQSPLQSGLDYLQVRRFTVVNQPGIGISWQPTEIYANTSTANVVVASKTLVNIVPRVV
jgi:hypothetical protein